MIETPLIDAVGWEYGLLVLIFWFAFFFFFNHHIVFFVTSFSIKINNYRSNTKMLLPSSGADQHTGSKCSTAFIYSRGKGCCHTKAVFFCRFVDALYICSTVMCSRRPSHLQAGLEVPCLSASAELCGSLFSSIRLQCIMWDCQLADLYWRYVHVQHRSLLTVYLLAVL